MPVRRKGTLEAKLAKFQNGQKRGLILSGQLVAQRATQKAPIDKGRLKRSIAEGMPRQIRPFAFVIDVGTNVEYAPYQEFGTGDKAEDPSQSKDPSRPGIPPHPYLRPALRESKRDIVTILVKNLVASLR